MQRNLKIYFYPFLIILTLLLGCKSANTKMYEEIATEEAQMADSTLANVNYEFEADSLSEENLQAFEVRVLQKLQDVADLIQILSNDSTEKTFRLQAKTMLLDNFDNKDDSISFHVPDSDPFRLTISQLADSLIAKRYATIKLNIINPKIQEHLTIDNKAQYKGTIFFCLSLTQNYKTLYPKDMTAKIILKKKQKNFGGTTKEVWEVFLGDIGF